MPPIQKYTKEEIIQKAYEIVKKEGFKVLNARRIAKELNCSVQPIFYYFHSMDELKEEVIKKINETYHEYMKKGENSENSYKEAGLAYIKFAKENPEFFKILFMQQTSFNASEFILSDNFSENIIKAGQKITGLSKEEQLKFHIKVWIFTHGLACLEVTKTIDLKEEEINNLLETSVREMLIGYRKERNK